MDKTPEQMTAMCANAVELANTLKNVFTARQSKEDWDDAVHTAMKRIQAEMQAQHEATWAMAMEAAAKHHDKCVKEIENAGLGRECYFEVARHVREGKRIRIIPCPPLQITNEKRE